MRSTKEGAQLRAIRPIAAGEVVSMSYIAQELSQGTNVRRQVRVYTLSLTVSLCVYRYGIRCYGRRRRLSARVRAAQDLTRLAYSYALGGAEALCRDSAYVTPLCTATSVLL